MCHLTESDDLTRNGREDPSQPWLLSTRLFLSSMIGSLLPAAAALALIPCWDSSRGIDWLLA